MKAKEKLRLLAQDLINMGYTIYTFDENDKYHDGNYFFVSNDLVVFYVGHNPMGHTIAIEYKPSSNNGVACCLIDNKPQVTAQEIADLFDVFTKEYSPKTLRRYNNNLDFKTLGFYKDAKDWLKHSLLKKHFIVLKNNEGEK